MDAKASASSIILSFEIVSDFGFRASDFIIPLTNIAENLAKNARLSFTVVRIGTDFLFSIWVICEIRGGPGLVDEAS